MIFFKNKYEKKTTSGDNYIFKLICKRSIKPNKVYITKLLYLTHHCETIKRGLRIERKESKERGKQTEDKGMVVEKKLFPQFD
jgi:hypothetical protein